MSAAVKERIARAVDEAPATTSLLNEIVEKMEALQLKQTRPSPVHLSTWGEIEHFAEKAARTQLVPKDYQRNPDAICIAVQMGSELGLSPMQSLINISVINGRPSVWGDALPGLCRASGLVEYIKEWREGDTFICEAKRKDDPNPIRFSFSSADAQKAGLLSKAGTWQQYPQRMMQMRARGFCLRDAFPDVLKGLISSEEAADIPFADTGLKPALLPVATDQPITQEEKPQEPQTSTELFIAKVALRLSNAQSLEEVAKIGGLESITYALNTAPEEVQQQIKDLLADAYARFKDEELPDRDQQVPLDVPQSPQGGKLWAEYAKNVANDLASLDTIEAIDQWEELNRATYTQLAIEAVIKRHLRTRREQVTGERDAQPMIPYQPGTIIGWYSIASLQAIQTLSADQDYLKWFAGQTPMDKDFIIEAREGRLAELRAGA